MGKIMIKNCCFGDGIPKICVPIVGETEEDILNHAEAIIAEARALERKFPEGRPRVDVVEFRADYYEGICNKVLLLSLLSKLRKIFQDRILLFTYRSEEEGGNLRNDRAENMVDDIYEWVIASGKLDMIDIELMSGNYRVLRLSTKAHDNGVSVILSNHDFEKTPGNETLIERFRLMEYLGGDLLKIAVMPQNEFDVKRYMELTEVISQGRLHENNIAQPIVTMSMGEMGKISRISGRQTGSAMTFAAVEQESAPGQLDLEEVFRNLL